jgi:antitoxin MazE
MNTVIRKWGNSPAVRLPLSMMSTAHFDLEQTGNITAQTGRIIIEPAQVVAYSLDQLVAGITPQTHTVNSALVHPSVRSHSLLTSP